MKKIVLSLMLIGIITFPASSSVTLSDVCENTKAVKCVLASTKTGPTNYESERTAGRYKITCYRPDGEIIKQVYVTKFTISTDESGTNVNYTP